MAAVVSTADTTNNAPPSVNTSTVTGAPPSSTLSAPTIEEAPVSPVSRHGSFPHRTISAAPVHPFIDTNTPAINTTPVELDGTPTSPETKKAREDGMNVIESPTPDEASASLGVAPIGRRGSRGPGGEIFSPGAPDEVMEELGGMRGQGVMEREKRAALLSSRSKDPAVLVDIPQTPGAEELACADRVALDAVQVENQKPAEVSTA